MAKKGYVINVRKLHYAVMTDDTTTATYEEIKPLSGIRSIKMTPQINSAEFYGEGIIVDQTNALDSIEVELDITKIPLVNRAEILGNDYENGILTENVDDSAPYIGLAFEAPKSNGKSEFVWLYKGKLEPIGDEYKQKEGNIEYQPKSLKLKFIPRESDGNLRKIADSEDEGFVETTATTWFDEVQ